MNVWAFPSSVFPALKDGIIDFFESSSDLLKDEFYLPTAVDNWIAVVGQFFYRNCRCKWLGVTYKEDKPVVVESIKK